MNIRFNRFSQYRVMWVFVLFDLPADTKKDKQHYQLFRKNLERDGFGMFQYSIYIRHCSSRENAEVHIRRVKRSLPPAGDVCVFQLTDKQFSMMELFSGKKIQKPATPPQQLELF